MILSDKLTAILILFIFTLFINMPFGYARSKSRKYSFRWFLYIHIPIPLIFLIRIFSHIEIKYIPLFILAALSGQVIGGRFNIT
ncbi:MAG: hypothetical protein HXY52_06350 [Nitrospirae bacterium]|nr:hypothetical protein [Nitrospirota bacterium]